MEIGIERLAALAMLLTSLSHIAAPQAWVRLFAMVRAQGEVAGLINAAIHAPLGLLIVSFHNDWRWPEVIVTVVGWALLVKSSLHLLAPRLALRSLALAGEGEIAARRYRLAGIVMLPLAVAMGWVALG